MTVRAPVVSPSAVDEVSGRRVTELAHGMQMCVGNDGAIWDVEQAEARGTWLDSEAPTTAAAALAAHGQWSPSHPTDFDAGDYWFRIPLPPVRGARSLLCLDGVATHAEAYLDGERVLSSSSMFASHSIELGARLNSGGTLHLRCSALAPHYAARRPRPRWPSRLASQRNLRYLRTTLLGRMPGFLPTPAPVGPYRPMWLVEEDMLSVLELRLSPHCGVDGDGQVELRARVRSPSGAPIEAASLSVGELQTKVHCSDAGDGITQLRATASLGRVQRWWPHTHGPQPSYPVALTLRLDGQDCHVACNDVAFRTLQLHAEPPGFGFVVNGVPLFARGACWLPLNPVRLSSNEAELRTALEQARSAGMNMLRLPGFSVYESGAFYRLCDELGILVWQDLMFANFDYPSDDPAFMTEVRAEVAGVLERIADRPSTALICGNSEAEQQAAMLGLSPDQRLQPLFEEVIARQVEDHGNVAYWPSTPHGGVLPFRTSEGTTHYYGVGAYERDFADLRAARVRFTPECLAFSHVPEDEALSALGAAEPFHSPGYRAGVPRDPGAHWDFGDTTEHYVERLYGVHARTLRRGEPERHLDLSRRAPGEVMSHALGVWRRGIDPCQGALVFTLRDVRPGAGWGVVANDGSPKAAYWALRRIFASRALWFVDEGLEGVKLWAANDAADPWEAPLLLRLLRADGTTLLQAERVFSVAPRATAMVDVEEALGHFVDASRAYRFGSREHDVIWASLGEGPDAVQTFYHPLPRTLPVQLDLGLRAVARAVDAGGFEISVTTARVAQSVRVLAPHCTPSDNYFDVLPGVTRRLHLVPKDGPSKALRARLWPLNARSPFPVELDDAPV